MKLNVIILALFILGLNSCCSKEESCIEKINEDCVCTLQYEPVCGCNDITYGNSCQASCFGIGVSYKGECLSKNIVGNYEFYGYKLADKLSDNPTKKAHSYDNVYIIFNNDKSKLNPDMKLFSGKSSVNFIEGFYNVESSMVAIDPQLTTKIAGTENELTFEDKYINSLKDAEQYTINGDILQILLRIEDGKRESMIFKRK